MMLDKDARKGAEILGITVTRSSKEKNAEGKDQTIVFPLEKLNEFIIDKKWVVEKPKEEPKVEKEKTKEEKFWDKLTGTDKKEEANSEESAQKEEGGSSSDKTE